KERVAEMGIAGPNRRATGNGKHRAGSAAMQIDRKRRLPAPQCLRFGKQHGVDIVIAFEKPSETILHRHCQFQIRTALFQYGEGGRRQNAIAHGTQPDYRHPRALGKTLEDGIHAGPAYSSMRASSVSITGISSRMGYTRW